MPKTIDITELILRGAHQSVMATRMALEDMVPACADIDNQRTPSASEATLLEPICFLGEYTDPRRHDDA